LFEYNVSSEPFHRIYIQALLDEIAPEESLVLTSFKAKDTKSLSSMGQRFKKIAHRRMAVLENLPSYNLWTQEQWTVEESVFKSKSDEPIKLMQSLLKSFKEDIKELKNR